jgi:formate/nitrite transporter
MNELRIDALLPAEMAVRAETLGVQKAEAPVLQTFILAILAGAFIAMGAMFATTVTAGAAGVLPYGVTRLLAGLVFCLGLVLVVVGGAELFTGNNLIVMAWASGKITARAVLKNWVIVYAGNFVGSFGTALLVFLGRQHAFGNGVIGETALRIALNKVQFDFVQAVALGIAGNALVCMAVWLTFSARSTLDKIAAVIFPITAFVAAGFEHSIANMYFIPYALLLQAFDPTFVAATALDTARLTWGSFLWNNLLPVTIGNVIGGTILVAAVYWAVYLRDRGS